MAHREIYYRFVLHPPESDGIYDFPINLEPHGFQFGSKSIQPLKMPLLILLLKNYKYNFYNKKLLLLVAVLVPFGAQINH